MGLFSPVNKVSQPLRVNAPKGWVLCNFCKYPNYDIIETYSLKNEKYGNLTLDVEKWRSVPYLERNLRKTKNKYKFVANIRKRYGGQEVVHTETFKTFPQVFSSSSFDKALKFWNEKENIAIQSQPNHLVYYDSVENFSGKKTWEWFSNLTQGRKIQWYSMYDCIVFPEEGKENFHLDNGTIHMTPYTVEEKDGKSYIHFKKPIKKYE